MRMLAALGNLAAILANSEALPVRLPFDRPALKAYPSMEQGQRILYMEASNEIRDLQGEKILLGALEESIPYFLKYGRIDLDHASVAKEIRGQRVNPYAFEIGRPLDAKVAEGSVWVKAAIFSSSDRSGAQNRFTEAADLFWDSLHTQPPVIWYPSVAGDVYDDYQTVEDGKPTVAVRKMRWHSIGLSRTPVNHGVQPVSTMPLREFAKAFSSLGDLKDALRALSPDAYAVDGPINPKDPDIAAMLQVISDTPSDAGIDFLLGLAAQRGIPPTHALATVLALLSA
jgi:hypothetical protein